MVTDAQVRLMRQTRMDGKTQAAAAAVSDMSLRTAREWEGPVGDETPARLADAPGSVCGRLVD